VRVLGSIASIASVVPLLAFVVKVAAENRTLERVRQKVKESRNQSVHSSTGDASVQQQGMQQQQQQGGMRRMSQVMRGEGKRPQVSE
jgi:hypothetical protein